jgi:hypothetical protein
MLEIVTGKESREKKTTNQAPPVRKLLDYGDEEQILIR